MKAIAMEQTVGWRAWGAWATRLLSRTGWLLVIAAGTAVPQNAPPPMARVRIPLTIFDSEGRFISGVRPESLRPAGAAVRVHAAEMNLEPRRVLLLLDLSASMRAGYRKSGWKTGLDLTRSLITNLRPEDMVALHLFAEKHEVVLEFTTDRALLARKLETLPDPDKNRKQVTRAYGTFTLTRDALEKAWKAAAADLRFGDAMVLVSDGAWDSGSKRSYKETRQLFAGSGVRLFVLRVDHPDVTYAATWDLPRTSITVFQFRFIYEYYRPGEDDLTQVALETGGAMYDPWGTDLVYYGKTTWVLDPAVAGRTVLGLATQIAGFYSTELEIAVPIHRPARISLEVSDPAGRPMRGLVLSYPHYLYPAVARP